MVVTNFLGYVRIWDISNYAKIEPIKTILKPPTLQLSWRAHIQGITCLELIQNHGIILTGSTDHTLRMWTTDSEYIGNVRLL